MAGLMATGSCLVQSQVYQGGKNISATVSIPSSFSRPWNLRIQRETVTLLVRKKRRLVEVQAKKSGAGSRNVKSREPADEEEQPAPETRTIFKLPGALKLSSRGQNRSKDKNVIFVAGATGKVGRRVVRELVKLGYRVRAGVRNVEKAQFLLEEEEEVVKEEAEEQQKKGLWANFSTEKLFGFLSPKAKAAQQVELVECDLEKDDDIESALGNAGVVICAIGASEKEVLDVKGPYRVDFKATKSLIDAASNSKVNHFILVTSLGTKKFGWPASVLNLFWGVLYWKAKAEDALLESGIPFTIVRPGGMERPTDAYKKTHNLRLVEADTLFGGQVSNLQVAELIAGIVSNLDLAQNKVLEAVAETTAPLRPIKDLLAEISTMDSSNPVKKSADKSVTTKQAGKQRQEEDRMNAQEAKPGKAEALRQRLQAEYESARLKELEAQKEAEAARAEKEEIERRSAEIRSKAQAAALAAREAKALETAILAAGRQGKNLSDQDKQDIISSVQAEFETAAKLAEAKGKPKVGEKAGGLLPLIKSRGGAEKKARENEAKLAAEQVAPAKAERVADAEAVPEEAEKKRLEAEEKSKKEVEKKLTIEAERKASNPEPTVAHLDEEAAAEVDPDVSTIVNQTTSQKTPPVKGAVSEVKL